MDTAVRQYVTDLRTWDLPRVEELATRVVDEIVANAPISYFDRSCLGDELHRQFVDRLRELAGMVVNESIEYWLRGLTDGNNGRFPEWCLEFPYWQGQDDVDVLTVAYCVDNEDGTRTEINRVDLGRALARVLQNEPGPADSLRRGRAVVAALRELAASIEMACDSRSNRG